MAWLVSIAGRITLVICVFGLVGPPVGGIVAWIAMGARSLRSPLPFIIGSYGEGMMLALWTGGACCLMAVVLRRVSWIVPAIAAVSVSIIWVALVAMLDPRSPHIIEAVMRTGAVFIPPSAVAAGVCWMIARPLL